MRRSHGSADVRVVDVADTTPVRIVGNAFAGIAATPAPPLLITEVDSRMPPPILRTPDDRYIVVRDRLWRASNPHLSSEARAAHVALLMRARRAVGVARRAGDLEGLQAARRQVDEAKHLLGERGPVWWDDGAPDLNRHMVRTTPYAAWYAALGTSERLDPASPSRGGTASGD